MMKKKQENKKWICIGITISLIASIILVSSYQFFLKRSQSISDTITPYESDDNINWIYDASYMLYRDLYIKIHNEEISYENLYFPSKDSNTSVWKEENPDSISDEDEEFVYWKEQLDSYFKNIESSFYQLNICYDYLMEDLETGEMISNLSNTEISAQNQYFYLEFLFDKNGNVTLGQEIQGDDVFSIRKYASAAIHENTLNNLLQRLLEPDSKKLLGKCNLNPPKNCRLIYCISQDSMNRFQQEGVFYLYDSQSDNGEIDTIYYMNHDLSGFIDAGIGVFFVFLFLFVLLFPIVFPKCVSNPSCSQTIWEKNKILHFPFELILIFVAFLVSVIGQALIILGYQTCNGTVENVLTTYLGLKSVYASTFLAYLINLILTMIYFIAVWILGVALCRIRILGPKKYFLENSVICKCLPIMKLEIARLYDAVNHFDVTKEAKKLILKIVLVNAIILFVICSLGMGGLSVAIVYSLFLYLVLRKYISNLQNKYGILLQSINKMAEGDLNIEIEDDLGVFEPFKPQLIRIRDGFQKAVDEEVKSQQMKAELITNVSHDLKTPLTAIITYVNLLKDENITEAQRKEYLFTLERKSLRLKSLIEDLFEVSKANSNTMPLQIMDVDIFNLVRQVVFELSDKLEQAHLDVRMDFSEEKAILSLDSQKTFRIYENLVNNIAKYALEGTRVYIHGEISDGGEVVITLKNISAQEIHMEPNMLTERFVRGDSSRNTEGSGLGLAIAESFAKLQGGNLALELDGDLFKVTTRWSIK